MSNSKASSKKRPTPEEIQKAKEQAAAKLAKQIEDDQVWLDANLSKLTPSEQDELLRQASKKCKDTTKVGDDIVVGCPLPRKLQYCVEADEFECPNGKVKSAKGCRLSDSVTQSLRTEESCIDGQFVSEAEGGSYMSPYVPWGPISGKNKDGTPKLTTGNSSGVTIGTGVDLGAVRDKDAYLSRLEKAGVSKETRDKISPLLGKKKADACEALREAKKNVPLVFPASDVEKIDLDAMQSRLPQLQRQYNTARDRKAKELNGLIAKEKSKKQVVPDLHKVGQWQTQLDGLQDFKDLTCAQQTVMFSTLYHEGSIGKKTFKPFVDAVVSGDDAAARNALLAKSKSAADLVAARGKRELKFYDGN